MKFTTPLLFGISLVHASNTTITHTTTTTLTTCATTCPSPPPCSIVNPSDGPTGATTTGNHCTNTKHSPTTDKGTETSVHSTRHHHPCGPSQHPIFTNSTTATSHHYHHSTMSGSVTAPSGSVSTPSPGQSGDADGLLTGGTGRGPKETTTYSSVSGANTTSVSTPSTKSSLSSNTADNSSASTTSPPTPTLSPSDTGSGSADPTNATDPSSSDHSPIPTTMLTSGRHAASTSQDHHKSHTTPPSYIEPSSYHY